MKGDTVTLSTGSVITMGVRRGKLVAHAHHGSPDVNRGAIVERPVDVEALAARLGMDWGSMTETDVTALTGAVAKAS